MTYSHTIVAHFPSHTEAETAVRELQRQGFDMQKKTTKLPNMCRDF